MRHTLALLCLMLPALLLGTALSAHAQAVAGDWEGLLDAGSAKLRLVLHLTRADDGTLTGSMDSPDQGVTGIPITSATLDGDRLHLAAQSIGGTYEGTLSADGDRVDGTWRQGGASLPLDLTRKTGEAPPPAPLPETLLGTWTGDIDTGAAKLPFVIHINQEDGVPSATADSPSQGVTGIPISAIRFEDGTLYLQVNAVAGSYEGTLRDGPVLDGRWKQGPLDTPLVLKPGEGPPPPARPQEPKRPYPYDEEDVRVESVEGVTLAGTLTLPRGDGPFPAVALVSGSGPQDRDEALLGHKPFLVLADYLTRRGIAVLRYDDRGVAESTGDFSTATSEDFADDALAAVGYLRRHDRVDASQVGIVGHSEGGLVAPMAAAESADVAFIVLLAGPGLTGEEIIELQSALIAEAEGTPASAIEKNREMMQRAFAILKQGAAPEETERLFAQLIQEALGAMTEDERQALGVNEQTMQQRIAQLNTPWFRFFLAHDPRPVLERVTVPVLAINGEKDLQVPARQNLDAIIAALEAGGNAHYVARELQGLNHLFQPSETGAPSEYAIIETTFSEEAMALVADWILQTVGR